MDARPQHTLERAAEVTGIGFLTGADVTLRFLPAGPNQGIVFQRVDCPGSAPIPALVQYTVPRERRTAIEHQGLVVEMVEHVLAALAGLQIDNCRVELNAPEPPGLDGSCRAFVDALMNAGIVPQDADRRSLAIRQAVQVGSAEDGSGVRACPLTRPTLAITYRLDYGPQSPIAPQVLSIEITPEAFIAELCFARTFVLESEAKALRAQGYGTRTTARDLLVFGPSGAIDNRLHLADECVRHKILDCVGDLALAGCDVCGHVSADRSGHRLNRELVRLLQQTHPEAKKGSDPLVEGVRPLFPASRAA